MKISALILTYNEECNIKNCLESISDLDDILVVDSGSTDQTCAYAKEYGARILTRPFDNFANQRNFGLDEGNFKNDWVLHLDADEVATKEFLDAIMSLKPSSEIEGYRVPSKIIWQGHWLRYSGMYPTYQVRLARHRMRFKQVGHGQREDLSLEKIATLSEPYLHYNLSHGLAHWLQRHIAYAEAEAVQLLSERGGKASYIRGLIAGNSTIRRRALKQFVNRLPIILRPPLRFIHSYFIRRGFLDGRVGLQYALMLACYETMIVSYVLNKKIKPPTYLN